MIFTILYKKQNKSKVIQNVKMLFQNEIGSYTQINVSIEPKAVKE